jgi:superfamily II DNA or RNA helicase
MKITNEIQRQLMDFARSSPGDIVLANYYFGIYEMDVFKLNDRGWITEYEIKISRADFKKDFSKSRQKYLFEDKSFDSRYTTVTTKKHDQLITGECKPNRFYFVDILQKRLVHDCKNCKASSSQFATHGDL